MKLLRFVNHLGNGIYQDGFNDRIGLTKFGDEIPVHQPVAYEDCVGFNWKTHEVYNYAFADYHQLVSWFRWHNPLTVFMEDGKLIEIDVDEKFILHGRSQCAFDHRRVKESRVISLDEFIENSCDAMHRLKDFITW